MAAFNKFNSLAAALPNKVHNLASDTLMVALCDTSHAPVATNTQLSNLTEISYTNCSSRTITTTSSTQTSGLYSLILVDLVLTASGGAIAPFRYVVVYNNTATNKELICWFDYGANVTINNGETFTIDFDNVNGLFQLQ
jgi:hypothetical protein